jgi:hypothetical protein
MKSKCALFFAFMVMVTNALAIDCPTCPYHYCPTDIVTLVEQDVVIPVPGTLPIAPFAQVNTIQEALSALENYKIKSGATVTIQLNQNADNYDTINITHADGDKIRIVSNCNGGACTIQFKPGVNGVYVANGHTLGFLDKLNLIGQQSDQTTGIYAYEGGNIICGINMTVQKFHCGVCASRKSYIHASNIISQYNSTDGIYAYMDSSILADNAIATHNDANGISVIGSSYITASNAVVAYNGNMGIILVQGSSLFAENLQVNNHSNSDSHGIQVSESSNISINKCYIYNNKWGMSVQLGSTAFVISGTVSNNYGIGIYVDLGSIVYAPGTTITGNNPNVQEANGGRVYQ